ncbi:hypothetical protein [Acinetobacter sp. P1(2025)]|uniref:hypothetical protein n=1 Tax=Acinetobacter sp. P1(2025) TaxID=3446120 RepID=UPI003F5322FD
MDKLLENYLKLSSMDFGTMRYFLGGSIFGFNPNVRGAEMFKSVMAHGDVLESFSHIYMVKSATEIIDNYLSLIQKEPDNSDIHKHCGFDLFGSFLFSERKKFEMNFLMWRNSILCFCDLLLLYSKLLSGNEVGARKIIQHIIDNYLKSDKNLYLQNSGVFVYVQDMINTHIRANQYRYVNVPLANILLSFVYILKEYADFFVSDDLVIGHKNAEGHQKYSLVQMFKGMHEEVEHLTALIEISKAGHFDPIIPPLNVCYSNIQKKLISDEHLSKFNKSLSLACDANSLIYGYFFLYRQVVSSFLNKTFHTDRENFSSQIDFDSHRICNVAKDENKVALTAIFGSLENGLFQQLEQLKPTYS